MRKFSGLFSSVYGIGVAGVCLALAAPNSFAITQEEAQHTAANTNHRGSDDDQDEAVRNAMMALMNLAALNIPGAFAKGYEAYGNYTNSEKLDDLEARTKKLRGLMSSADQSLITAYKESAANAAAKDSGVSGKITTTLSRLDTGFLYKGQTGQVAEEFEKRSGMKREELFRHLAAATDAHYTYDDPELLGKLEQRWQAFKERIPNKEFRDNLDKAEAMFPHDARVKGLNEAMLFYKNQWTSGGSQVAQAPSAPAAESAPVPTAVTPAPMNASASAATESRASEQRAPASLAQTEKDKDVIYPKQVGQFLGLNGAENSLNEFLQNANVVSDDDSIFKMVTLRYRKLTPGLVAQRNVGDAK